MKNPVACLILFCCLWFVHSCSAEYTVLEYLPLTVDYGPEEQVFSLDLENSIWRIDTIYWEGGKDMSEAVNDVQYECLSLGRSEDRHYVGPWFSVDVTHEPLKLMVELERNPEEMPRHIELYVKMRRKDIFGKETSALGLGYHIFINQSGKE